MVLGYMCEEHGYQRECDIDEKSGARLCYECGMEVTGLTGHTRGNQAPPSDDPMAQAGDIRWTVTGYSFNTVVTAFDYEDAIEMAIKEVDNPQTIKEVYPQNRQYRR